jgi:hypothetical protein
MSEQEKQAFIASGRLISIAEASAATPYSAEYLSLLARKGRLRAVKISRDWLTTREAVLAYVEEQKVKHQQVLDSFHKIDSINNPVNNQTDPSAENSSGDGPVLFLSDQHSPNNYAV